LFHAEAQRRREENAKKDFCLVVARRDDGVRFLPDVNLEKILNPQLFLVLGVLGWLDFEIYLNRFLKLIHHFYSQEYMNKVQHEIKC
jgi:hypothetical protein